MEDIYLPEDLEQYRNNPFVSNPLYKNDVIPYCDDYDNRMLVHTLYTLPKVSVAKVEKSRSGWWNVEIIGKDRHGEIYWQSSLIRALEPILEETIATIWGK